MAVYLHVHTRDAFEESKHPRGQPKNKGEFAKVSGGGGSKEQVSKKLGGKQAPVSNNAGVGVKNSKTGQLSLSPTEPNKTPEQVFTSLRNEAPRGYEKFWDDYLENYEVINELLRFGAPRPHLTKQTANLSTINGLKNYLAKTKTTKPLTLLRGIDSDYASVIKKQLAGASANKPLVLEDAGFVSTTTDIDISKEYGNSGMGLILDVPVGTHAAAIGNESESEVLMQPGTRIIMTGERDKVTGYYKAKVDQSHMVNGVSLKENKPTTTSKSKSTEPHLHPADLDYEGQNYSATGKIGIHHNTGESSAEYESENGDRVWRRMPSGVIEES